MERFLIHEMRGCRVVNTEDNASLLRKGLLVTDFAA